MSNTIYNREQPKTVKPDALDKAIALIFLTDALVKEHYEGCAGLIDQAKRNGARTREINRVLARFTRRVKGRF